MSVIDEIKARLDIVDVIGGYVPLQKAGRTFKAPCPFHTEKTPSFIVNPDRQTWHCFGACATGGDIIGFITRKENLDFAGALRFLARGFAESMLIQAGLTIASERGGAASSYDRFRGRLMFPIRDDRGRIVGFGGRVLPSLAVDGIDTGAKYLNTALTPIFDKGTI